MEKDQTEVVTDYVGTDTGIDARYMGTDADRHDRLVLGRRQALRVRKPPMTAQARVSAGEYRLTFNTKAQLPLPLHCRIRCRPHCYMGTLVCVGRVNPWEDYNRSTE